MRFSRLALALVLSASAGLANAAQPAEVALLELDGPLHEQPNPLEWLFGSGDHVTLSAATGAIHTAARSSSHKGILIRLKDAELSPTQTEELGQAIKAARKAGKKVHVFAEAYTTPYFLLASYADEALAQPGAPVMLSGMHMEEMFLADTLSWIGLKADFVQVGDYKGASEMMSNSKPSPAWDQNINQLLDSMYANVRAPMKAGRKLDDAKLDTAMKEAWLADAAKAVDLGLLDAEVDWASIVSHLDKVYGTEVELDSSLLGSDADAKIEMSNPFAMLSKLSQTPDTTPKKPSIAVLHLNGTIIDGDSAAGGLMGGGESVGSRTFRRTIEELIDEPLIQGVVVRINSPGGSASASEVMYQGLKKLSASKPVWVSVGSMAASGGYYCLVGGQKVYVNPSSIVGSIGVVGGRLAMDGLYSNLKINVVSRSRGPNADMFRSTGAWSPAEVATVRAKMTETYNQFTSRVSAGRPGIDLAKTAEGRLFTGDKAISLNMADRIGGLHDAVNDLASELKLSDFDVMHFPGPKSLPEVLEDAFGSFVTAPNAASPLQSLAAAGEQIFGPAWPQVRQAITGVLQLRREPVLLMTPSVLIVK